MFELSINTNNDAFNKDLNGEIARILREVAKTVENGKLDNSIIDINGNIVGNYIFFSNN